MEKKGGGKEGNLDRDLLDFVKHNHVTCAGTLMRGETTPVSTSR